MGARRFRQEVFPKCFATKKLSYGSKEAAQFFADSCQLKVYKCPHCGRWHMTSKGTLAAKTKGNMKELEVIFSCRDCGLKDVKTFLPIRKPDQGAVDWMEKVCIISIAEAHCRLSPNCLATEITEVKIPISSIGIGFLPDNPVGDA